MSLTALFSLMRYSKSPEAFAICRSKILIRTSLEWETLYGEDVIISEWFVDYTHADWGKVTHDQVSVQKWKDGKVVHERFYYGT